MAFVSILLSLQFIALTVYWLLRRFNPQGVLLVCGLLMMAVATLVGIPNSAQGVQTGSPVMDIFERISGIFSSNMLHGGLMIVTIGGYAAYMKAIRANSALVHISMHPLSMLRRYPYLAACMVIPLGQVLFACIPSATGMGLLMAASILPVLLKLGVSRLTAASLISACTVFDIGPGSANALRAAELVGFQGLRYFVEFQLPLAVPSVLFMMAAFFFTNRWFDRRDKKLRPASASAAIELHGAAARPEETPGVPLVYALLPVLPLLILLLFSRYVNLLAHPVSIDISTAVIVSLFIALLFELVRLRSFARMFLSMKAFWEGMGKVFGSVITLIVCAEVFSEGLVSLGFVDAVFDAMAVSGFSGVLVGAVLSVAIFLGAVLMGSGNASFFSFSPLVPGLAARLGIPAIGLMLPVQFAAGIGRTASPIASVIIAVSDTAGVSPIDLARRNALPLSATLLFMLLYNYFVLA